MAAGQARSSAAFSEEAAERQADRVADQVVQKTRSGPFRHQHRPVSAENRATAEPVRGYVESHLGQDLGKVRVHTDERAAEMSQSLRADAFTYGHDIYFNRGRFAPDRESGMRLLAHELAHVAQQSGTEPRVQRQPQANAGPWRIPTTGSYKDIPNNPWGGLPQVLYPQTPADFMSLTVIEIDVDQMARINFDAETLQGKTSGERRLPHSTQWTSFLMQDSAAPTGPKTLAAMEAEYQKLRARVLEEVASLTTPALKAFLTDRIVLVTPPFSTARSLRRGNAVASPEYLHEDRLIRRLLEHTH